MDQPNYLAICDSAEDETLPLVLGVSPIAVTAVGWALGGVDVVFMAVSMPAAFLGMIGAFLVVKPASKYAASHEMSLRQGTRFVQRTQIATYAATFALTAYFGDMVMREFVMPQGNAEVKQHERVLDASIDNDGRWSVSTRFDQPMGSMVRPFRPRLVLVS